MDDRDYKAFIVEGEFREPQVIDNISKRFFNHGNCKLIPLPAGENIYMLWKKLEADDFETDIIEVLRESSKESQKLLEGLSREDFSEVFLFFDYDAHQTNLGNADGQDALKQMLESFDNETENGKLYVSYLMALVYGAYSTSINVFDVEIPMSVRAAEISAEGSSIYVYDPKGKAACAYSSLIKEVMNNG